MDEFEKDSFLVGDKNLIIGYPGHGTLYLNYQGKEIHVDPVGDYADYEDFDQADLILITHHHGDHLDREALRLLAGEDTLVLGTEAVKEAFPRAEILAHGVTREWGDISVTAVPAYNTTPGREKFHPPRRDNGYILSLGGRRIYIAGDTEEIPEMADLGKIFIAFLPMNQPYTMVPEQCARAARLINPDILVPYHFGDTDTEELIERLKDWPGEVRIRRLS